MNPGEQNSAPKVTPELIAEASAWVAILHGPSRTNATERGFASWLGRSESHARAFEEATEIWEEAGTLPRPISLAGVRPQFGSKHEPLPNRFRRAGLLAAAAVAAVAIAVGVHIHTSGVSTGIGEQRVLVLDDGSRVILNTHTRVVIDYGSESRQIDLKDGEALFEVAKDASRPFIVTAGDSRIRALGTSFNIRRDASSVAVTLVNGTVAVSPVASRVTGMDGPAAAIAGEGQSAGAALLAPGQRLTLALNQAPKLDRPQLDKLLAWQRREVALDNVTLSDAMAEMNRYSRRTLVAELADPDSIRTTGLFRAGDSISFARAVAEAYGLYVSEESGKILLLDKAPEMPR